MSRCATVRGLTSGGASTAWRSVRTAPAWSRRHRLATCCGCGGGQALGVPEPCRHREGFRQRCSSDGPARSEVSDGPCACGMRAAGRRWASRCADMRARSPAWRSAGMAPASSQAAGTEPCACGIRPRLNLLRLRIWTPPDTRDCRRHVADASRRRSELRSIGVSRRARPERLLRGKHDCVIRHRRTPTVLRCDRHSPTALTGGAGGRLLAAHQCPAPACGWKSVTCHDRPAPR